jgi:hypothetical protein
MRTLAVPLIALALAAHSYLDQAASYADEPASAEMRTAFEARLAADVEGALAFVAETGGPAAVEKVREAGTDRFAIRSFRKLDCARMDQAPGFACGFEVEIDVVTGTLRHTLSGRFLPGQDGLVFRHEA